MTLINHPGSYQQAALACLDSGTGRDAKEKGTPA